MRGRCVNVLTDKKKRNNARSRSDIVEVCDSGHVVIGVRIVQCSSLPEDSCHHSLDGSSPLLETTCQGSPQGHHTPHTWLPQSEVEIATSPAAFLVHLPHLHPFLSRIPSHTRFPPCVEVDPDTQPSADELTLRGEGVGSLRTFIDMTDIQWRS